MKKKITKNNNNKNGQEKNRTDQPAAPNIRDQQLRTKRIDVLNMLLLLYWIEFKHTYTNNRAQLSKQLHIQTNILTLTPAKENNKNNDIIIPELSHVS